MYKTEKLRSEEDSYRKSDFKELKKEFYRLHSYACFLLLKVTRIDWLIELKKRKKSHDNNNYNILNIN